MTPTNIRAIVSGLALTAFAVAAAAQDQSPLLTTIEIKRLVAIGDRESQARLRDHFAALADEYEQAARRHAALARMPAGNPNHPPAVSPRAHEMQFADAKADSAATLREVAAHHDRLARGLSSTAPSNSARFENGEGAPLPTDAQVRALVASARTPADHRALEEYFITLAGEHERTADKYYAIAQGYRASASRTPGEASAAHYAGLAKRSRDLAREALAAAGEQHQLAGLG